MYYTLSTIAQVLAAFLALSGVFVLFKLQQLDELLIRLAMNYSKCLQGAPAGSEFQYFRDAKKNLDSLIEAKLITTIIKQIQTVNSFEQSLDIIALPLIEGSIGVVVKKKRTLKWITYSSLLTGAIAILYSIVVLSITHLICESHYWIYLIIAILLASATIAIMTIGIILSLDETDIKKT